jgi:hypothetical protein
MSLSQSLKDQLLSVFRTPESRDTVVAAIDAFGSGPAAAVAAIGTTSNLSAAVVANTTIAASNLTAAVSADPTKAEVDAGIDTLKSAVVTALNLKADNVDVETLRTQVEARLDVIEAKIDALIAALKASDQMST